MPDSSPTKFPHCGKAINCTNNLQKHLRSCEKVLTHPAKQQLHQTMLHGPTSSKNEPSTPTKLMVDEAQVGSARIENAEHWKAPEIKETTLKYTALTFRKTFDSSNKRVVLQRLEDIIHRMRPVIEARTRATAETVKWYLSLNMNFCKSTNPGVKMDPTVTFRSEVFKSIDTPRLDYQFYVWYSQTVQQIVQVCKFLFCCVINTIGLWHYVIKLNSLMTFNN